MRTDLFDFELPAENIALRPASPRDSAKMLVVQGDGVPRDCGIADLPHWLKPGDQLVVNDTKVISAQLRGRRRCRLISPPGARPTIRTRATTRPCSRPMRARSQRPRPDCTLPPRSKPRCATTASTCIG